MLFPIQSSGEIKIGDIVIATLNNATTASISNTLGSLFAELDLQLGTDSDLVIKELDQWRNPDVRMAAPTVQTFNLVVVAEEMN
jgi:hypothetical protein